MFEVVYRTEPAASPTIATENHNPRLKPENAPITIAPSARRKPMVRIFFMKEKSARVMKTVAVKPVTKSKVIKPAVMMRLLSPVRAVAM